MTRTFDYGYTKVRDLYAVGERRRTSGKATVSAITVQGEKTVPTKRFWKSFFVRFGISDSVFRYFEPTEVFQRISERAPDDLLRYCLERNDGTQMKSAICVQVESAIGSQQREEATPGG